MFPHGKPAHLHGLRSAGALSLSDSMSMEGATIALSLEKSGSQQKMDGFHGWLLVKTLVPGWYPKS